MTNIRPSSEIRNNYQDISKLCKESKTPVYITVNGKGDTALIDIETLDELYARLELYSDLLKGLKDLTDGNTKTHEQVFANFK